jgi:hypothetical protein
VSSPPQHTNKSNGNSAAAGVGNGHKAHHEASINKPDVIVSVTSNAPTNTITATTTASSNNNNTTLLPGQLPIPQENTVVDDAPSPSLPTTTTMTSNDTSGSGMVVMDMVTASPTAAQ